MRIHTKTVFDIETGKILADKFFEYSGPLELADRSVQKTANQNSTTAGSTASGYGTAGTNIGGFLTPTLERDVTNPIGYTPQQRNDQLVASQQAVGGVTSGITGEAGLRAGRTRNAGALSAVLDQAARQRGQQLSTNALDIQNRSADLAQKQRASALAGLQGLYGTDVGANLKAMGIQDEDLNTALQAGKSGWLQNLEGGAAAIGSLGGSKGVAGIPGLG